MNKHVRMQQLIEFEGDFEVVRIKDKLFRVGYCSLCGACCQTVGITSRGSKDAIEWIELHNIKVGLVGAIVQDSREQATDFTINLTFPCPCKELEFIEKEGRYRCNNYTDRPGICKGYPRKPTNHKSCTYIFLDQDDLNWFTKEYTKYWREQHGQEKKIRLIN